MSGNDHTGTIDVSDLVERYWQRVYKLCLFYLRDSGDAEDAAQITFEKVFKKSSQFQGQVDPFTWIYRIAANTALNMLRRRKIIRWLSLESDEAKAAAEDRDPAKMAEIRQEEREKLRRLEAGVKRMSSREKTAFYLFYYEKLSQKEIAAILNASTAAVEALVHKAIKKIRCL